MTGYLTGGPDEDDYDEAGPDMPLYDLFIPNAEIRGIFRQQIMELFREETRKDGGRLSGSVIEEGYRNVLKYGIACYKKRCRVALGEG